jgi:hypothetical protein
VRRAETKPSCEPCREIYKEKGEDPPCRDCLPPLDEENEQAVEVFMAVKNQVIMGFDRIIDINLLAVAKVMDIYGVKDQKETMVKIVNCFRTLAKDNAK